jgi:DNA-binding transcriptional ArsR family regulator
MMDPSLFEFQAEFCKAMGNTVRLQIVHVLREHPKTVHEICREIGLPQGNISRHLACLRAMGVVVSKRDGIEMVYQISDEKIVEVCDLVRRVLTEQIQMRAHLYEN